MNARHSHFRWAATIIFTILSGGALSGAIEADPATTTMFDEVVVTARRSSSEVFNDPYTINTLGTDEMRQRAYRTVPEALRYTPGVMVQKTGHGQGSPFIRGFTSFRSLLLIDGIRVNNSVFRPGPNQYWATVDPYSLDHMEVVKGPSSVMYGSDAIGGTVNALTIRPSGYGEGVNLHGTAYTRLASAERSILGRGQVDLTYDQTFGFVGGFNWKHFGDLEGGRDVGTQEFTSYDEYDADFKAVYNLSDNAYVVAVHQRVFLNNAPRTHKTMYGIDWENLSVGSDHQRDFDQQRELTYLQYHATDLDDIVDEAHFSLSWQTQSEIEHRITGSGSDRRQGFDVGTLGFFGQLISDTPIGRLTYGVEYYHDEVSSFSSRNDIQGPVADEATYDMLGLYVQDAIALGEQWEVILGGRFTYVAAESDRIDNIATADPTDTLGIDEEWTAFTGSARAVYKLIPDKLNLFGGYSQGFRAPNWSDLSRLDDFGTDGQEVPATGLDSEFYHAFEAGLKARGQQWSFQTAYFHTLIRDQIVRYNTGDPAPEEGTIWEKDNLGDGYIHGIELSAALRPHEAWTLFGNFTWMEGKVDTITDDGPPAVIEEQYVSRIMPITVNLGARWDVPNTDVWVEGLVTHACDADKLAPTDIADTSRIPPGGTPDYTVLSMNSGWKICSHAEITFGVENLLDEDYRIHGSGLNAPGRNFVFTLKLTY